MSEEFYVTPWEVRGKVDYRKLLERFGARELTAETVKVLESMVGEVHYLIRRGFFYAHRDFDRILERARRGLPWALYTGRGPSGPVHIGHLVPWILAKWFVDKFGVELFFQMTDDEKFLDDDEASLEETHGYAYENALDLIALDFPPDKLHLIIDTEDIEILYKIALKISKKLTWSTVRATFGFTESTNIGLIFFPSLQIAVAFLPTELRGEEVHVLIPAAIDQDPYFRLARDIAESLGYPKPATLYSRFISSLSGESKMSASIAESAIYTTDAERSIRVKIMNAFTGGQPTAELQRKLGGNPDICPVYEYHKLFDPDDKRVNEVYNSCKGGHILCGECKALLFDKIASFIRVHVEAREKARDKVHMYKLSAKLR